MSGCVVSQCPFCRTGVQAFKQMCNSELEYMLNPVPHIHHLLHLTPVPHAVTTPMLPAGSANTTSTPSTSHATSPPIPYPQTTPGGKTSIVNNGVSVANPAQPTATMLLSMFEEDVKVALPFRAPPGPSCTAPTLPPLACLRSLPTRVCNPCPRHPRPSRRYGRPSCRHC